jgi:hypothetical protein
VSEYGGDASGDIAAAIPTWYRSDVRIAELRALVSDGKLAIRFHLLWAADLSVSPAQHPSQGLFVPAQGSITCATESRINTSLLTITQNQTQAAATGKGSKCSFQAGSSAAAAAAASLTCPSTLLPQSITCLLETDWFWGASLTLSLILGVSVAGLCWTTQRQLFWIWTHSSPSLLLRSALCSPQQQPPCKLQMVHKPQLCLQRWQTPPLALGLRLLTHPCCQQSLCWCPRTFLTLQCPLPICCPLPCAYGQRMLTYLLTLPGKQFSMCMPILRQSSANIPQQIALDCPSRCRSSWLQ